MFLLYFGFGVLFSFLALQYAEETIFNWMTLILIGFASFDFFLAFKLLFQKKKKNPPSE